MLAYNDIPTYTFVQLYDADHFAAKDHHSRTVNQILTDTGFEPRDDQRINLDLGAAASGRKPTQCQLVALNGGEGFLECKLIDEKGARYVELQLGAGRVYREGLFGDSHYTPEIRCKLMACIEKLASLEGFQIGFAVHLGDDEDERHYREWFSECLESSRFSLSRLLHHGWLSIHSLHVGPAYFDEHGRDVFLECPTWKTTRPSDDTLCLFLDNLDPAGAFRSEDRLSDIRKALPYLRNALKSVSAAES